MPKLKKIREIKRNCYASKKLSTNKKRERKKKKEKRKDKKEKRHKKEKTKEAKWAAVAGKRTPVTVAET